MCLFFPYRTAQGNQKGCRTLGISKEGPPKSTGFTPSLPLTPAHFPRPQLNCYFPSMLTLDITVSSAQ